jgi:Family of unknown function (DUF6318)
MRRALAAAAVLAFALSPVLAGCTDDDGQSPTPTDSSPPPSGHTTTPGSTTSDPADEPPVLPDAAKAQTTAGAKAFVRYYADVLNYAWLNLDPKRLDDISADGCKVCNAIVQSIDKAAKEGGYQHGGQWTVTKTTDIPDSFEDRVSIITAISIAQGSWRQTASDRVRRIAPSNVTDQFLVIWTDNRWRTLDVSST